ncbi:MAG: porV [Bacteroidetes bacterium]|nr:porV [Bacteroidota bacterium]
MKKPVLKKFIFLPALAFSLCIICSAQDDLNAIPTSVPLINVTSNARIGAMGEIATVSSSVYNDAGLIQNPALLSKNARTIGGNTSFMPWLRGLWSEPRSFRTLFSSAYLTESNMYGAINQKNAIGYRFALSHFGQVIIRDQYGMYLGEYNPIEYCHQITYSHTFKDKLSAGAGIKYIHSDLNLSSVSGSFPYQPANAAAVDLGIHYNTSFTLSEIMLLHINTGATLNNFGTKISYTDNPSSEKGFLPTCLRIAIMVNPEWRLSESVTLHAEIAYQIEKLLVPTPPILYYDDGDTIIKGRGMDVSVFTALYSSFYDAPGGFSEEMHEIMHKTGTEFRLDAGEKFYAALRAGRLMEHRTKGNRTYTTMGMGLGYAGFSLDSKYIAGPENTSLNKTWAITFGYCLNLDNHKEDQ